MPSSFSGVLAVVLLDRRDKKYVPVTLTLGLITSETCRELGLNNKLSHSLTLWRKLVCHINEPVRMTRI